MINFQTRQSIPETGANGFIDRYIRYLISVNSNPFLSPPVFSKEADFDETNCIRSVLIGKWIQRYGVVDARDLYTSFLKRKTADNLFEVSDMMIKHKLLFHREGFDLEDRVDLFIYHLMILGTDHNDIIDLHGYIKQFGFKEEECDWCIARLRGLEE